MFSGVFLLVILLHNSDAYIYTTGTQMVLPHVKFLKCRCDLKSGFRGRIATFHDWKQVYVGSTGSEHVISHVSLKNAFDTVFSMELQRFDNNTDIYTSYTVYDVSKGYKFWDEGVAHCTGANRKVINLVDDGYYQYHIDRTLIYDSTPVKFQCQVNDPSVLTITAAWISNTENRIFPFNEKIVSPELTVEHDGSMLCCIYYTYTTSNNMVILQRFVKSITLLVYHNRRENTGYQNCRRNSQNTGYTHTIQKYPGKSYKSSQQSGTINTRQRDSGKTNEVSQQSGNTDKRQQYPGKSYKSSQQSGTSNTRQQDSGKTNEVNQQSGNTDKRQQYPGKSYKSSQQSGTINTRQQDSGKTNEVSQQSGNTDKRQQYPGKSYKSSQQSGTRNTRQQDSGKTNEVSQQSGNTDKTRQDSAKTNELDTETTDGTNKNFDNEGRKEANVSDQKNGYSTIIIISSISAVMAVVIIFIFAIKTSCWKKYGQSQKPRPPMPLPPTQPAPYMPYYENVALRGDCEMPAKQEPHYDETFYH